MKIRTHIKRTEDGKVRSYLSRDIEWSDPRVNLIDLFALVEAEAGEPVVSMEINQKRWASLYDDLVGDWGPEVMKDRLEAGHAGILWGAEVTLTLNETNPNLLVLSAIGSGLCGEIVTVSLTAELPPLDTSPSEH